eukprot:CAMPEP_0119381500 /NCGR_PEP_ID=MMETSP1334-20130426/65060_1 /TAXON_ID=127549 /ORGANISM="Calcidiscus leptoporus, Strain RCC1130" /LENGTH=61 /DNA_ID=CAMNT_0007401657 /DNA_START=296 /DNA_END=479 /DNA_ORIENTATION=-
MKEPGDRRRAPMLQQDHTRFATATRCVPANPGGPTASVPAIAVGAAGDAGAPSVTAARTAA